MNVKKFYEMFSKHIFRSISRTLNPLVGIITAGVTYFV